MNKILIHNGKLILPNRIIDHGFIAIENNQIVGLGEGKPITDAVDTTVIDAKGNYISPGFIDIHVHGGGGHDFMDGTLDAYIGAVEAHAKHGTTGLLPTTLTSTDEELFHTFDVYKEAKKIKNKGAKLLGIHLEGPYFSYAQKGAQDPQYLKEPATHDYHKILNATDDIVRWSIAPELPGALELGDELSKRGIIASVAHTDAVCSEVIEAFGHGYELMTHFYSAMSSVTRRNAYRYAGAVEAGYLLDGMKVEIIVDGIHLPKELLQLIYKVKGVDNIILITDAMRGAGMPDGNYLLGSLEKGQEVLVEDGVAKLLDRSAFAGSVATADRLVRVMTQLAGVPLVEAIQMLTLNPAKLLRIEDKKGHLALGKDADIVVFDNDINVELTIVEGNIVYKK